MESKLKAKARKRLEKSGWEVLHLITTNKPGIPDTLVMKKGRSVFIEFKDEGKKVEDEGLQEYRIRKLRENKFEAIVVDHIDQINYLCY